MDIESPLVLPLRDHKLPFCLGVPCGALGRVKQTSGELCPLPERVVDAAQVLAGNTPEAGGARGALPGGCWPPRRVPNASDRQEPERHDSGFQELSILVG